MTDSNQLTSLLQDMNTNINALVTQVTNLDRRLEKLESDFDITKGHVAQILMQMGQAKQSYNSSTKQINKQSSTTTKLKDDYYTLVRQEIPCYTAYGAKDQWLTTDYDTFVRNGTISFTPEDSGERQAQIAGWSKYLEFRWLDNTRFQVRKKNVFIPANKVRDCIARRAIYLEDIIYEQEYTYSDLCLTVRHFPSTTPAYVEYDILRIQQYVDLEELPNGNYVIHETKELTEEEQASQTYRDKYGFVF